MNNIFIHDNTEIPQDFFKIETIVSIIGGCKYYDNIPITFEYNMTSNTVIIIQENHYGTGLGESLLSFFNHYNYTKGYKHLLLNKEQYEGNLKILNSGRNISNGWELKSEIYLSKIYLNNILSIDYLPKLFYLILSHNFRNIIVIKNIELKSPINKEKIVKSKYNISHFTYQLKNIEWMINLENKIKNDWVIDTYKIPSNLFDTILYYVKIIDNYIIVESSGKIVRLDNSDKVKIYPKGGVIADDVGLGKTLTILSLINEKKEKNCSLIICPKRLIKNWENEIINNVPDLNYKAIYTITQWRKLNNTNINDYDLIIVPYNLLINQNYIDHYKNNNFNILDYIWSRVVLDEGHEYISNFKSLYLKNITQKNYRQIKEYIKKIKADYYWLCSATPFSSYYDYWQVIDFLCGYNFETEFSTLMNLDKNVYRKTIISNIHHLIYNLTENLFIKNKKQDINLDLPIPIITNNLLEQSPLEKIIYKSEQNKYKQILLCSHILVSEDNINNLGCNPLTIEELYEKMNYNYGLKIARIERKILKKLKKNKNKTDELSQLEKKIKDENTDIYDIKFPLNNEHIDFNEITNNLKQLKYKNEVISNLKTEINNNECSICFDSFNNIQKGILHCGHYFCVNCIQNILKKSSQFQCPICRKETSKQGINIIKSGNNNTTKWGTKILSIIDYINNILNKDKNAKFIIFSQWDNMLKLISKILIEYEMKYIFINGSAYSINKKILSFRTHPKIKIILISSDKNVSGLHLPEVNYIILLGTFNTESKLHSKVIEEQAIGRSYRIGQKKQIYVSRFIMKDTIEEEYYNKNCF